MRAGGVVQVVGVHPAELVHVEDRPALADALEREDAGLRAELEKSRRGL
jgi:hypothetical protein